MELTDQEFKKLVLKVAVKIAPKFVNESTNSDDASTLVATYSFHIADAVKSILKDPSGHSL